MTDEIWMPIPNYEGQYSVSNLGKVRSETREIVVLRLGVPTRVILPGRFLKPKVNDKYGHLKVNLSRNGKRKVYLVHRLVLLAFVGPSPEGMICRHIDGNASNNVLENLKWGTHQENTLDSIYHGTQWQVRKTHCPKGHPYDTENTRYITRKNGLIMRACKACASERNRVNYQKKKNNRKEILDYDR